MSRGALLASHLRGILRALRVRGVWATAAVLWHQLHDRGWDRSRGTDTEAQWDVRSREPLLPGAATAMPYVASRARPLSALLAQLPLPRAGTFVDLGCGKGRAMVLAAEAGFTRVRGVELSPHLAEVARANLQRLGAQHAAVRFDVQVGDLGDAEVQPGDQVFHAFHPCTREVLSRALQRIAASLRAHPREAWVLWQDNLAEPFALPELDGLLTCRVVVLHGSRYLVCGPSVANLGGVARPV